MNQTKGSLTDTMVKLVLIFFISLLSFSVGTVVGQYFAEGQRKYTNLEADYNSHRETASVSPDATEVKPEEALTDEDIANLTEEFVKSEKEKGKDIMKHDVAEHKAGAKGEHVAEHKAETKGAHEAEKEGGRNVKVVGKVNKGSKSDADEKHGAEAEHKEAKTEVAAKSAHVAVSEEKSAHGKTNHAVEDKAGHSEESRGTKVAVQEAAERIAHGETPTKAPAPVKRVPSSLPPPTASSTIGKFTVQIAAYATEGEAQKRVQGLKEKGFSAFTVTAQKGGKNWYRVGVGLYSTLEDATTARKDLLKQTELKDAFVQKIVE